MTVAPGPGYGQTTSHPQQSKPPRQAMAALGGWLSRGGTLPEPRRPAPGPADRGWLRGLRGEILAPTPAQGVLKWGLRIPFRLAQWKLLTHRREQAFDRALDARRDSDRRVLFVWSGNEPLREELDRAGWFGRLGRWPNLQVRIAPGCDHTLRSLAMQRRVHALLDDALEEELERERRG